MQRFWVLVGTAVGLGLVGALLKKKKGIHALDHRPKNLETTIVVGGTPQRPTVKRPPEEMVADPRDRIRWHIVFEFDNDDGTGYAEVWLRNFKHRVFGDVQDPCEGREEHRRNRANAHGNGPKVIREVVRPLAFKGLYKYDIYLNQERALDPDIRIREAH